VLINTSASTCKKLTAVSISISTKTRAVSNVTGYRCSILIGFAGGLWFFSCPPRPDQLFGLPNPRNEGYRRLFPL